MGAAHGTPEGSPKDAGGGDRDRTVEPLQCKDCENWYGAEDDEFGPCMLKNMRGDQRYITQGVFRCDEGRTIEDKEAPP